MSRHLSLRSGNPALSSKTFQHLEVTSENQMTLNGTVNKTAISLAILLLMASFTYITENTGLMWFGFIGGFILALITIFKQQWAPYTVPVYAALEGLALGGISLIYEEIAYTGIVQSAAFLTFGIFGALLFAYKTKIIKPTENFKLGIFAATGGIAIFYLISIVISFFGEPLAIFDPSSDGYGGWLSIGFSLFVVVIAALNLVLDFDFIEEAVENGAPKYMEWYGAFGLLVTLVWLYLEILRLLSKLNSRN